ncbi:peptidoglycan D,D-transpeptidase FtsI family protein [Candidatus Solincola sp.]|nr:penicillin-binding transpeptidase domain-containing protein [Actinomycetota bacterium]MDI7252878.1 penicillin-binding transpeptidase domain-containing protein [Actinomycetota bacterium]
MQKGIRRLGVFFIALTLVLVVNLSYLQVWGQKDLMENPANTRRLVEEYGIARGRIITSDGLVLAESEPAQGPFAYRRRYHQGSLFSHILGYDSPQFGRSGLEEAYNEQLLGRKPPRSWVEEMTSDVREGNDVYLTLDAGVQSAAAKALGSRKGAVVAMNPKTGAVLAMYSWPTYEPQALVTQEGDADGTPLAEKAMQNYSRDTNSPLLNRAAAGLYTPGSVFKVVTASAGLEAGFSASTAFDCPGVWEVGGSRVTNYGSPPRSFGSIDMETALTYSVNTYFAQLAVKMGASTLVKYAEAFGLNSVPPLDLPGVSASRIPPSGRMDAVQLAWSGAGQGEILLTPLQLCLVGCAVANGGKIMTPHLLKEVRKGEAILERYDASVWRTPISADTAAEVLGMMISVVEKGTGTLAAISGVTVAGKTGTAEVEGKLPHAWFLGIAPAENPSVVVAVVVENSGGAGGSVAAPIAREVIRAALK